MRDYFTKYEIIKAINLLKRFIRSRIDTLETDKLFCIFASINNNKKYIDEAAKVSEDGVFLCEVYKTLIELENKINKE